MQSLIVSSHAQLLTGVSYVQVKGDAFLAKVFDDGQDGFERRDLGAQEVSSSAAWVKAAAAQNARKQQEGPPKAFTELQQPSLPKEPAAQAKDRGNAAFKQGAFEEV